MGYVNFFKGAGRQFIKPFVCLLINPQKKIQQKHIQIIKKVM